MSEESTKPQTAGEGAPRSAAPRMDKDAMGEGGQRFKSKRRRKVSYLTINKIDTVDYKEINILRRFLNDRGKILPSRQTGNTAKQQRMIASAIRKAREMALLPFVVTEMGQDRREYGPRRERNFDRAPRGDRERSEPQAQSQPQAAEAATAE
jgi:small subunit ribosomal protein S18